MEARAQRIERVLAWPMIVAAAAEPWRWYIASLSIAQARRCLSHRQANAYSSRSTAPRSCPMKAASFDLRYKIEMGSRRSSRATRRLVVYAILVPQPERLRYGRGSAFLAETISADCGKIAGRNDRRSCCSVNQPGSVLKVKSCIDPIRSHREAAGE